jgi:type IV secretion system protein VirD4
MEDESGLLNDLASSFLRIPEKEFGSILSTATRQTEILDNPQVIATLRATGAGSEVDFARWHKGTMTVYLCLSAPKFPTFNRWLRLILTAALDEMTDKLDPPRLPVCFMLDELATLGHLQSVENAVGLAAGYGVQLVTVFQDVAQMKELYKGRWASFIGNAGIRALFNLDDFDSALYWSKFMGNCLDESHGRHEDAYGLSDGENIGEVTRPLISPEKIMMDFAKGQMLVLAQGAHPILTTRTPYYQDATLAGLWDDPRAKAKPSQPAQPRGALSWLAPEAPAPVQKVSPPPPLEPEPAENLQNMMDELLGRPSNKNDKDD